MAKEMTPRQRAIFDWISAQSNPPTVREIGAAMGIASPNGVITQLKAIEAKGFISRTPRKARNIRVVGCDGAGPVWYDKPTCPGWWVLHETRFGTFRIEHVERMEHDRFSHPQILWYGPIPEPRR